VLTERGCALHIVYTDLCRLGSYNTGCSCVYIPCTGCRLEFCDLCQGSSTSH